jgi:hypothetical protein
MASARERRPADVAGRISDADGPAEASSPGDPRAADLIAPAAAGTDIWTVRALPELVSRLNLDRSARSSAAD